ncbi:protein PAM68, chloroplastic [Amborella trichopoda]|uniref:Protein PAM68, chloroplastic n=1 Tax=Amborella trichopoda TaxID=13333 RepID=U5CR46_AMBTC|nr:protein PAM68, chloroplastic [Amborella trichopoda]ERN15671.1 hypothetical protein AMTR_s00048p00210800 [Amborella trichopoda]|eukprot:XP_020529035.1 protein PAM68, chloroplastic [Amborella trichopoda]
MESCSISNAPNPILPRKFSRRVFPANPPKLRPKPHQIPATTQALKGPKGFGPSSLKKPKKKQQRGGEEEGYDSEEEEETRDDTIPEIVTNRMMGRMGFSVGIPLFFGLFFFPVFYYLKVILKVDIPNWLPFIVSFFFFGSALLGVSYGIVSSSWDPLREGSFLGWKEAQKNWPVFWDSLRGNKGRK